MDDAKILSDVYKALTDAIDLSTPEGSSLIEIKTSAKDPEKAAKVTALLAQKYLVAHARDLFQRAQLTQPNSTDPAAQTALIQESLKSLRSAIAALEYPQGATQQELETFLSKLLETSDLALSSYGLLFSDLDVFLGGSAATKLVEIPLGPRKLFAELESDVSAPTDPVATRSALIAMLALFLGVIIGVLSVLLRTFTKRPVYAIEDVTKQFDIPVWASVLDTAPESAINVNDLEDYRDLRSSILLAEPADFAQVILLSSARPQTTVAGQALRLAKSYQAIGKSVLVLDTDLRDSALAAQYSGQASGDLAALLSAQDAVSENSLDVYGLNVVIGGKGLNEAIEGFSSGRFASLLAKLRQEVEIIILASTPAGEFSDTAVLQPLSDVTILGIHPGRTSMDDVEKAMARLKSSDAARLGFFTVGSQHAR